METRMRMLQRWAALGFSIVCLTSFLSSCAGDRPLAFEVIYQSEDSLDGQEADPGLYVVAGPGDLEILQTQSHPPLKLVEQLAALDYRDYVVVIISRGYRTVTTTDLIPQTRQVIRRGDQVVLQVYFGQIDPDKGVKPADSNAYQAIAVRKEGRWGRRMRFVLEVDEEGVREQATLPSRKEPTPTLRYTPTMPPLPTAMPTPAVTPIPTVAPPVIPEVAGKPEQPFWLFYWQDNEVWRIDDRGQDRELLLDTYQRLGQWLTGHPMPGTDCCPGGPRVVVSPDGQQLALVVVDKVELTYKDEPFTFSIYLFDAQSGDLRSLGEGTYPVWSADGQRIAFVRKDALWIADLKTGRSYERVTKQQDMFIAEIAWSPLGNQVAYMYDYGAYQRVPTIWPVNTADDGTPPRPLLSLDQSIAIYRLVWSPDGQQVLFLSPEGARDPRYHKVQDLWSVSLATGGRTQLTRDMQIGGCILSPDRRWLLFSAYHLHEQEQETYDRDVWLLSIDGRDLRRVTAGPGDVAAVGWSPSGAQLIIKRKEGGPLLLSLENGTTDALDLDPSLSFSVGGAR